MSLEGFQSRQGLLIGQGIVHCLNLIIEPNEQAFYARMVDVEHSTLIASIQRGAGM